MFKNIIYAYDLDGDQMFVKYDCISIDKYEMLPIPIEDDIKKLLVEKNIPQDLLDEIGDFTKLDKSQLSEFITRIKNLPV